MESYADLEAPPSGDPRGRSYSRTPPPRDYENGDERSHARGGDGERNGDRERSPRGRSVSPSRRDGEGTGASGWDDEPGDSRAGGPPPARPRHAPKDVNPSEVVGVFGLSIRTTERDLEDEFNRIAPVAKVIIVYDARTDRSRGFGFVTMQDVDGAQEVIKALNGIELHGRKIRVDFSATKRAHSPTPGEYRGNVRPDDRGARGPPPPRGGGGRYGMPPPMGYDGYGGPPGYPPAGGYGRYGPPPPGRYGPPPPRRGYGPPPGDYGYGGGYGGGGGGGGGYGYGGPPPPRGGGGGYGGPEGDDWRRRASPPRRGGPGGGRDASPPPRSRRHRDSPSPPPRRRESLSPPPRSSRRDDY